MRPVRLILAGVVVLMLVTACDEVAYLDGIVLVNETEYAANVDVRGDGGNWLGLGTVSANETREIDEVIDQGAEWTFRFSYATYEPVELTLGRDELMGSGWRVEVPVEFEESLRAEGVSPPP